VGVDVGYRGHEDGKYPLRMDAHLGLHERVHAHHAVELARLKEDSAT
jgi:hypothetical protein